MLACPASPAGSWTWSACRRAPGCGLGRALVRHALARARAGGCPAFLETGTPRNVPFYESLGFRVVGEQQAPDGEPVIWFTQTPPAPSSAATPAW
jgi:GNAT superfamily N-acetyltransferase